MKIICTKLSDSTETQGQLFNSSKHSKQQTTKNNVQNKTYSDDVKAALAPAEQYLNQELKKFNLIKFRVRLERIDFSNIVKCTITTDSSNSKNSTTLDWLIRITVNINTMEVKKDSAFWSGLKSCASNQVEYLKQCVDAVQFISNLDWSTLLNIRYPNYDEYYAQADSVDVHKDDENTLKEQLREYAKSRTLLERSPKVRFTKSAFFVETVTDTSVILMETLDPKLTRYTKEAYRDAETGIRRRVPLQNLDSVLRVPLTPIPDAMFKQ